jgi:hypothetical protein
VRNALRGWAGGLAAAAALALSAWPAAPAGAGEIVLPPTPPYERPYPLLGEPIRVAVRDAGDHPVAGAVVEVVSRPNSSTSHTAALPPTDAAGVTRWTPAYAGIVALTARAGALHSDGEPGGEAGAEIATARVAVRYGGFPPSGLLVMLVAGVLLFGGAALGFVKLLGGPGPPPTTEAPST